MGGDETGSFIGHPVGLVGTMPSTIKATRGGKILALGWALPLIVAPFAVECSAGPEPPLQLCRTSARHCARSASTGSPEPRRACQARRRVRGTVAPAIHVARLPARQRERRRRPSSANSLPPSVCSLPTVVGVDSTPRRLSSVTTSARPTRWGRVSLEHRSEEGAMTRE
jgi:hypothetical protein